jgi:hypothetical protein
MRINLTDVETRDFEAIPPGNYRVRITGYDMRVTQDKPGNKLPAGTPMINWEFTVVADQRTGDEAYKGRKVWTNTIIHERTLFNLKSLLEATGNFTTAQLKGSLDFEPEDILDQEVVLRVTKREYPPESGNFSNEVKGFKSASSTSEGASSSSLLP